MATYTEQFRLHGVIERRAAFVPKQHAQQGRVFEQQAEDHVPSMLVMQTCNASSPQAFVYDMCASRQGLARSRCRDADHAVDMSSSQFSHAPVACVAYVSRSCFESMLRYSRAILLWHAYFENTYVPGPCRQGQPRGAGYEQACTSQSCMELWLSVQ